MRKILPYNFEVVPYREALGVINTTTWNKNDLYLRISASNGSNKHAVMPAIKNELIMEGLEADKKYEIYIRRKDIAGRILYKPTILNAKTHACNYVVLVGASVGRQWNLPELPMRTHMKDFCIGYRGKGSFDKKEILIQLMNSKIRPNLIVLKECAAYFPRKIEDSRSKIEKWYEIACSRSVRLALATCAPVTLENEKQKKGRLKSIKEFNEFIREFARLYSIPVLDIEKVLKDPVAERLCMRIEYAKPDVLHLGEKAYKEVLDPLFVRFIQSINIKKPFKYDLVHNRK